MLLHPNHDEHEARKKWTHGDWCRAGGLANWAAIGRLTDHPNYGFPHVVDHTLLEDSTNCIFCGKEIDDL